MNILYLPIFEAGTVHEVQVRNKRGLYDALVAAGHQVREFDYLNTPQLEDALQTIIRAFQPDLMLTQLHGHEPLTAGMMHRLRALLPAMRVVNWSGDSWRHSLVGEQYLPLVREFDLQLCAAPDMLPEYEALGIRAAFWQIAYEKPIGALPAMPQYDVVFLGNQLTQDRLDLFKMLRGLDGLKVGIYGDWAEADGYNCYDFGAGAALYRSAKVAIADNVYPDQQNYVSNRPIQILMAGGATLLHQHVPRMGDLLGIRAGEHFIEWVDLDDLRFKVHYWATQYGTKPQLRMVKAGKAYAQTYHTYTERVRQLFDELLPIIERVGA